MARSRKRATLMMKWKFLKGGRRSPQLNFGGVTEFRAVQSSHSEGGVVVEERV